MQPISVLATVTGRDRPGVIAAFFAALAAHDVDVRDVEQVVIRDRIILTVLFDARGDTAALRNSMTIAASALGLECEVAIAGEGASARPEPTGSRHHVIVLGNPLRPGAISHVAQRIADSDGNIEAVAQLSTDPSAALDMLVRTPDPAQLRESLVRAAAESGVDICVEPAQLRRRAKRLILLNADATLVRADAIARGELAPLPDAGTFVRTLRRLGFQVGALSDGCASLLERLRDELELDFVARREEQAIALQRFADRVGVPVSQTVAVGAGVADFELIGAAGLGIAFSSAGAQREPAEDTPQRPHLGSVLFVLGVTRDELAEVAGQ
jgi:phosphoserine phosphatase